jgi:hypothetical protein
VIITQETIKQRCSGLKAKTAKLARSRRNRLPGPPSALRECGSCCVIILIIDIASPARLRIFPEPRGRGGEQKMRTRASLDHAMKGWPPPCEPHYRHRRGHLCRKRHKVRTRKRQNRYYACNRRPVAANAAYPYPAIWPDQDSLRCWTAIARNRG